MPSLTLIEIAERDPASPLCGVPHKRPVLESNDAHEGLPVIENLSGSPSLSLAVGWNS
jgi:hypothetical protein